MKAVLKGFMENESGSVAIEYGLLAALIGVMVIAGVTAAGTNLRGKFNTIASAAK